MLNHIINNDVEEIFNSNIDWFVFKDKTVVITGSNGFLGSYLCRIFFEVNKKLRLNIQIICLVRESSDIRNIDFLKDCNFSKIIKCDICNPKEIFLTKVDYIIHAASNASPIYYKSSPIETIDPNLLATKNLLEIAKKNSATFLFVSSGAIYGEIKDTKKITEVDYFPINPEKINSCYSLSKKMGEVYCYNYKRIFNLDVKIARIFHTLGPGLSIGDGRVFSDFIDEISQNKSISIKGDGLTKRSFSYISDSIIALLILLTSKTKSTAYNIGNPKNFYSIIELALILKKNFPNYVKKINFNTERENKSNYSESEVKYSLPSIDKISKELKWIPKVSVEEAFERTIISRLKYGK